MSQFSIYASSAELFCVGVVRGENLSSLQPFLVSSRRHATLLPTALCCVTKLKAGFHMIADRRSQ